MPLQQLHPLQPPSCNPPETAETLSVPELQLLESFAAVAAHQPPETLKCLSSSCVLEASGIFATHHTRKEETNGIFATHHTLTKKKFTAPLVRITERMSLYSFGALQGRVLYGYMLQVLPSTASKGFAACTPRVLEHVPA
jgi:hypothetical protein